MPAKKIDGQAIAHALRAEITAAAARHVAAGDRRPGLAAVLVGDNPASEVYVRNKRKACEDAGASALSLVNTYLGTAIDWRRRRTVFAREVAGLSGPAIKPMALLAVLRTSRAVRIPIVGIGGIAGGADALEFLAAGASAVQVGTACFLGPEAPVRVAQELAARQGALLVGDGAAFLVGEVRQAEDRRRGALAQAVVVLQDAAGHRWRGPLRGSGRRAGLPHGLHPL